MTVGAPSPGARQRGSVTEGTRHVRFETQRNTVTAYRLVESWAEAFMAWYETWPHRTSVRHIVVITDENVWTRYALPVGRALGTLGRPLVPIVLRPGEDSKDVRALPPVFDRLVEHGVHRRDLVLCIGGGVVCDVGGLVAQLSFRGMDYVNIPTSLMAQLDGAIGGKVGANLGSRKNLLGGFHHPSLVLVDPSFLGTLPEREYVSALAEALKMAIILDGTPLLDLLESQAASLSCRDPIPLREVIERCMFGKLELLRDDPYEQDLDRVLNLGHAVAHALERLFAAPAGGTPTHGEAVAIGIASVVRYSRRSRRCSATRAARLLHLLEALGLPVRPVGVDRSDVEPLLRRIPDHRGGRLRLVVPVDRGVEIQRGADLGLLLDCVGAD